LIACPDDYLLQRAVDDAVRAASAGLGVEPEELPDGTSPEDLAFELGARSLFASRRLLVLADIADWLGDRRRGSSSPTATELLLERLCQGPPEDVVLVLGACTTREPAGALAAAVAQAGAVRWLPLPPPPKPWEDTVLSAEQRSFLRRLLAAEAPELRLTGGAEQLLLDRLGFAPRLLAQEARTLATAVPAGEEVDEALVRRLSFPPDQSLDAVRDCVLTRSPGKLLDLLHAAAAGQPVNDWRGQRMSPGSVPVVVVGQVVSLLGQLLYLRRLAADLRLDDALDARAIASPRWYPTTFKPKYAPRLREAIQADDGAPFSGRKTPTEWTLSQLFAGAARYTDRELIRLLADAGDVEAASRGAGAQDRLASWCASLASSSSSRTHP
jgi:hypothetical protein